jgi:hypothetical protein
VTDSDRPLLDEFGEDPSEPYKLWVRTLTEAVLVLDPRMSGQPEARKLLGSVVANVARLEAAGRRDLIVDLIETIGREPR